MDAPKASSGARSSTTEVFAGKILLKPEEIPFAHFAHLCKLEEVLKVMIKEWELDLPKIMLLILSDNGPLKDWGSYKQQEKFLKGLVKGTNATSMWIFTSGLNIGISKTIGDAVQADYNKRHSQICYRHSSQKKKITKAPLIGLSRENLLTYREQFENPERVIPLVNKGNRPEEQRFNLNPYHSHLLIIQDKSYRKDGGSRFLLRLTDVLRLAKAPSNDAEREIFPSSPVPIIAILIQGNLNSIHYILAHLKRNLPILIIRGSGGLADVFAYAYHEVCRSFQKIKDKEYVETVLKKGLNDKITSVFPSLKDNKMAQNFLCGRILECIEISDPPKMKHISVLNVLDLTCNMEDLPFYLLQALFKSEKSEAASLHAQLKKDLQLTIDWNCPEIALTKVFYKDIEFKVENDIFERVLLEDGREAFVSLFLENGFVIHKYLCSSRLLKLFEHSLKQDFFREVCWEGILGYGKVTELDNSFIDSDLNWLIESLTGIPLFVSAEELNKNSVEIFDSSHPRDIAIDLARRKALTMIFIWALISYHSQLAIVLWCLVDQPVMTALTASLILDKMKIFINEAKTQEDISSLSKKFASMAVGVFDLCYNDMPSKAYDSLNVRLHEWAGHSVIDMAALSQNRTFVSHPCCQKLLTNKFMGNIKIRELTWGFMTFAVYIKVILCAFLIFPMYLWVRFKESTIHEFVGRDEYEPEDAYYKSRRKKEKIRAPREEAGRSHLLRYQYPPLWQMIFWMWSAPITKFWVSNIFYILYLTVFSLAVLWPSCGSAVLDSIVCIWTILIAVDSTYLLFALREAFPYTPLFGPCLEIIYMILFVIFLFLIRISDIEAFQDPYTGKILICGALICFYYRMIYIYLPISSTLGPLLYRAKAMITVDFVNYMKMVVFILTGNAIVMQTILYPDYPLIPELVRKSFHKAFIAFFLTPVEELTKVETCPKWEQKPYGETICRVSEYVDGKCSTGIAFWPYILVFQYILLLKLILMTVLFALFNNTGARLGPEMDSIWKFQRYKLIVNFSHSLRLPPPLNIFSVVLILYNSIVKCCKGGLSYLGTAREKKKEGDKYPPQIIQSSVEYTYWRQLANDFYAEKEQEKKEESYTKKELDVITQLSDDLNLKEILIYGAKAQITQLETDIYYTHAHLETLKYRAKKEDVARVISLHSLSRESPYPRTNIQRFPVPDKYVPWEVMWLHYEPPVYTMPKEDFPPLLQPYVDDDILLLQKENESEIRALTWNVESVDSKGMYRDRKSWITDKRNEPVTYRLDVFDLPRNPMGRTGLRGKGALPRWGPNHSVLVVITRWRKKGSDVIDPFMAETSDHLEYVETWFMKKKDISLPGIKRNRIVMEERIQSYISRQKKMKGFAWSENKFEVVQSCFKLEDSEPWINSEQMIQFFKDHAVGLPDDEEISEDAFKSSKAYTGYMDDQLNTDQAWKEVELWHIHYNIMTNLYRKFKVNTRWRLLTEDVFIRLPFGQTTLLQDAIRPLNVKTAQM